MSDKNTEQLQSNAEPKNIAVTEWQCFLLLIVIIFPIVSLTLIAAYGFAVWMSQMFIFGPPGADDCGTD